MNPVLEEIITTGNTRTKNGSIKKVIGQITEEEGHLIQNSINDINAEIGIEVGLAFGTSALYICEALKKTKKTKHFVIDPYQMYEESYDGIGLNNLKRAGYEPIVEFIEMPSHKALVHLETQNVKADFAFIDGWHTFDHALVDFFLVDKLLKIGGIVIMDDADWPAIRKVCSFISKNRAYKLFGTTVKRSKLMSTSGNATSSVSKIQKVKNYLNNNKDQEGKNVFGAIAFKKVSNDYRLWDHFTDF
ncbi:MAG: class I SAM-dependent methyltransferase [Ignavibacteria bacterium]